MTDPQRFKIDSANRRGYALMPRELTAENGAKTALSGEFFEEIELTCSACGYYGSNDDCELCGGEIAYTQRVAISWSTVKRIYAAAIEVVGKPTKPAEKLDPMSFRVG